jgi:predicted permease
VLLGGGVIGASIFLYAVGLGVLVRRGSARLAIAMLSVKLLLFLALGWFAFHAGRYRPDPIGFALGVSCLPVAAVWEALRTRGES